MSLGEAISLFTLQSCVKSNSQSAEKSRDFDRQKIIGNVIVDFYCVEKGVVIEVDGGSHDHKQDDDAKRDAFLRSSGLLVIRLLARDVLQNLDGVMRYLQAHPAFH